MDGLLSASAAAEAVRRLPSAEAAQWLVRWVCDEGRLKAVWEAHRGRCYDDIITFPVLVELIHEALTRYGGSGRRAFEAGRIDGRLTAAVSAAFDKLRRLPIAVSAAFLEQAGTALNELVVPKGHNQLPASLAALHPIIIDGKVIKRVAKRLKATRALAGGLIGGRALVAVDGRSGLALAMEADADGDRKENALVPGLLVRLRRCYAGPRLYVADCAFGTLVQAEQFTDRDDHFLVRLGKSVKFQPDPQRPAQEGVDDKGRRVVESWGVLGGKSNRRRRPVRRIELHRAGEETIVLATDLDDAAVYPANDLLSMYHNRQGIEGVFQQATEVFGLKRLIGSSPQAGLFQFALCLTLYNIVRLLVGYVAEGNDKEVKDVSRVKYYDDLREEMAAWRRLIGAEFTASYFAALGDRVALQLHLRALFKDSWNALWQKSQPQPNRKPPPRTARARKHYSVHRVLQKARQGSAEGG
jgi:hypothetical protein